MPRFVPTVKMLNSGVQRFEVNPVLLFLKMALRPSRLVFPVLTPNPGSEPERIPGTAIWMLACPEIWATM